MDIRCLRNGGKAAACEAIIESEMMEAGQQDTLTDTRDEDVV